MNSNVDQQEIDKFSAHSQDWWDLNGSMKALHDINPLRTNFISQCIDLENKTILDVGCGGGILCESLSQAGGCVTGIDMADKSIDVASAHAKENNLKIQYQTTTIEEMVEQNTQPFDVITCLEMLEHVPNPQSIVDSCNALLKPGGHIFFSTINRNAKAYLMAVIGAEYILNLIPRGTHEYAKFIKPSELNRWCRQNAIYFKDNKGIGYNPMTRVFSLTDDLSVNYIVHAQKNES